MSDCTCQHCGAALADPAQRFCCKGCAGAYELIHSLGLDGWYQRRILRDDTRAPRPEDDDAAAMVDPAAYVTTDADGIASLHLLIDGLHCAACVWLIENMLARQPGVTHARLNMTTRRLALRWRADATTAETLVAAVTRLGYRVMPYDPCRMGQSARREEHQLLRALAVAGFAASNIMLLSVAIWAGYGEMGTATRTLLHWVSALIALPAVAYAGRPFYRSAWAGLKAGRMNMDVPISLGVTVATAMSLWQTIEHAQHAYFDASTSLLFFLLVGRYLDRLARGRAQSAAEQLLGLAAVAVRRIEPDGSRKAVPAAEIRPGDRIAVGTGERIGADGAVALGQSEIDCALVTGESLPAQVGPGARVHAGTVNLGPPIEIAVTAAGEGTLLAEIARLMENAEQGRTRFVRLADQVARRYAPVVHVMGLSTLILWLALGAGWQESLLNAVAVLIITCPCALALAVPAVQVVASSRLFRAGILLKSADALERLAQVDTVVLDKTGTLTRGKPVLRRAEGHDDDDLRLAAALAADSRHVLSRALVASLPAAVPAMAGVVEEPGAGLRCGDLRLGSAKFCGIDAPPAGGPEIWLRRADGRVAHFVFTDAPRKDAADVLATLQRRGLKLVLLSGDRRDVVAATAAACGIDDWRAEIDPAGKVAVLSELAARGAKVLMVGDGLNDAPALAAAFVSLSPSSAADISQTAADAVFQGDLLAPVATVISVARRARRLVWQNIALSIGYNLLAVPLAVAGLVTPLIAAAAMSSSSLLVSLNSLRLRASDERIDRAHTGGAGTRPAGAGRLPVGPAQRPV
ncbi:MAG: cadmium-translocating P-type ATPase [Alphaproteobacteria bacterium]|jgi:Cu2+-exporting ATPase|nr:cadmium-translocating P-type ATPase [Alphaproteobacteria bacterium]